MANLDPLFSFAAQDPVGNNTTGANPNGDLTADASGNLYGTASAGGTSGAGAVFELSPNGAGGYTQKTLYSFTGNADGANPLGSLTADASGNLYGTAFSGGTSGRGTVFELSPNGAGGYTQKTLYSFTGNADGANPQGSLTADASGNLYGTTANGGTNNTGAVFELVKGANGYTQQTLYSFAATTGNSQTNTTGASPTGSLTADASGNLYGTANSGGTNGTGAVFELVKGANGYTQQTLASFGPSGSNASGANPYGSLTADASGNLYGTAYNGGTNNTGAVFRISNSGFATSAPSQTSNPPPATTNPNPPANNAPCYCTGTQILTNRGEVAVEELAIGDVVVTATGTHRPIRWIGTRSYIGRFANTNPAVLPVCVKAGALADGIPSRDLWVSPDHALYLDGVLIPAEYLVNGATIVKADRVESVTYWHIELDSHDVLLAEGAPAESFVDDGGRAIFHNAASYRALYPHQPVWPVAAVYCAERVTHGYALEAVRRRLALRAGLPVAPARVFGELLGHLDLCDGSRITGWAQDLAHPDGPVCLDIVVDGAVLALAYAETYRADLQAAGIGDGCHAFDLELPQPLAPGAAHTVEVRRSADGALVGALPVEAAIAIAA